MARFDYGLTTADFAMAMSGRIQPGAVYTAWSARIGGTQILDLQTIDGVASTVVTADASGIIGFRGPDESKSPIWLDGGVGGRVAVRPVDITGGPGPEGPPGPVAGPESITPDMLTGIGNLLTRNQATAQNITTASTANSTLAAHAEGVRVTSTLAGAGWVGCPSDAFDGGLRVPVAQGQVYTGSVQVQVSTARQAAVSLGWFTSAGTWMTNTDGIPVQGAVGSWVTATVSATPPANAAFVNVVGWVIDAPSGESHLMRRLGVWKGRGGSWSMPGEPIVGLLPPDGSITAAMLAPGVGGTPTGTGSPEGVRPGNRGDTFTQTDHPVAGGGVLVWRKATGAAGSTTGWRVVEGDSGIYDFTPDAGWTGTVRVQRLNGLLIVLVEGLTPGAGAPTRCVTWRNGWVPSGVTRGMFYTTTMVLQRVLVSSAGIDVTGAVQGQGLFGTLPPIAATTWPTTAPA